MDKTQLEEFQKQVETQVNEALAKFIDSDTLTAEMKTFGDGLQAQLKSDTVTETDFEKAKKELTEKATNLEATLEAVQKKLMSTGTSVTGLKNTEDTNAKALKKVVTAQKGTDKDVLAFKVGANPTAIYDSNVLEDGSGANITRSQANFGSDFRLANSPAITPTDPFDVFQNSGTLLVGLPGATSFPYLDQEILADADYQGAEGTVLTSVDSKYVERSAHLKTIGAYTKLSEQILNDINLLQTWSMQVLLRQISQKYNEEFFNGTGTGSNITGLTSIATDFVPTDDLKFENGYPVSEWNVIQAVLTHLRKNNFQATRVFISPSTYYKLLSERATNGQFVNGPSHAAMLSQVQNANIEGAQLIVTNWVGANEMYIGELSNVKTIYKADNFNNIEVGMSGTDFTSLQKTMRGYVRMELVCENNYRPGIVKVSDIEQTMADLVLPTPPYVNLEAEAKKKK